MQLWVYQLPLRPKPCPTQQCNCQDPHSAALTASPAWSTLHWGYFGLCVLYIHTAQTPHSQQHHVSPHGCRGPRKSSLGKPPNISAESRV